MVIIGGTAAALAYKYQGATQDIDTVNSVKALEYAIEAARRETGYEVSVNSVGVFDPPYCYEDRLVEYKANFKLLRVWFPEVIDLILMKISRCEEHDLQAIEALVKSEKVKLEDLLERYRSEMSQAIKRKEDLDFNLLVAIERAFGIKGMKIARGHLQ